MGLENATKRLAELQEASRADWAALHRELDALGESEVERRASDPVGYERDLAVLARKIAMLNAADSAAGAVLFAGYDAALTQEQGRASDPRHREALDRAVRIVRGLASDVPAAEPNG